MIHIALSCIIRLRAYQFSRQMVLLCCSLKDAKLSTGKLESIYLSP